MALAIDALMRSAFVATLATTDRTTLHPYPSLVEVATDWDGAPLLLLSGLARHTRNLEADPRAALLYDQRGVGDNPLAHARVSVIGRAMPCGSDGAAARYVRRHRHGRDYLALGDFAIWRMEVSLAHHIGGFGRIRELPAHALMLAAPGDPLALEIAQREPELIERIRTDAALQRDNFDVIGIDSAGVDLRDGLQTQGVRGRFSRPPVCVDEVAELAVTAAASALQSIDVHKQTSSSAPD